MKYCRSIFTGSKQLNSYLEEVRAKMVSHYQQLDLDES